MTNDHSIDLYSLSKQHIVELVKKIYTTCNVKINYGTRFTKADMIIQLLRHRCSLISNRKNGRSYRFHSPKLDLTGFYRQDAGWYFPVVYTDRVMRFQSALYT